MHMMFMIMIVVLNIYKMFFNTFFSWWHARFWRHDLGNYNDEYIFGSINLLTFHLSGSDLSYDCYIYFFFLKLNYN